MLDADNAVIFLQLKLLQLITSAQRTISYKPGARSAAEGWETPFSCHPAEAARASCSSQAAAAAAAATEEQVNNLCKYCCSQSRQLVLPSAVFSTRSSKIGNQARSLLGFEWFGRKFTDLQNTKILNYSTQRNCKTQNQALLFAIISVMSHTLIVHHDHDHRPTNVKK